MKRKLIKQGGGGLTLYLPKKWLDAHRLKSGDEVEITETNGDLLLTAQKQTIKRQIVLTIPNMRETVARMLILNAYRAGFDVLTVSYKGTLQELQMIVDTYIIGFECSQVKNQQYCIESVSEPQYEQIETMIVRMFFMLKEIIKQTPDTLDVSLVHRVQKYDNFLKRTITKGKLGSQTTAPFTWQFLSTLSQIARACFHYYTSYKKQRFSPAISPEIRAQLEEMITLLQKAYQTKNIEYLHTLHLMEDKIVRTYGPQHIKKNPLMIHHVMSIARLIYLANSPLMGTLELEHTQNI